MARKKQEKRDNNNAQNQDFQISDQIFNANFNQRPIEDHNSVTNSKKNQLLMEVKEEIQNSVEQTSNNPESYPQNNGESSNLAQQLVNVKREEERYNEDRKSKYSPRRRSSSSDHRRSRKNRRHQKEERRNDSPKHNKYRNEGSKYDDRRKYENKLIKRYRRDKYGKSRSSEEYSSNYTSSYYSSRYSGETEIGVDYSKIANIFESSLKSFHDKTDNKINNLNKECKELNKECQRVNKHIPKINQSIVLINQNIEKLFVIQKENENKIRQFSEFKRRNDNDNQRINRERNDHRVPIANKFGNMRNPENEEFSVRSYSPKNNSKLERNMAAINKKWESKSK